jgi:hypothetical protein
MKDTNVILYPPGGYGHFINWCCEYFSGNLDSDVIPLNDLGNCHNFKKSVLLTVYPQLKNYTDSAQEDSYIQIHHNSFSPAAVVTDSYNKCISNFEKNLSYLTNNYQKTICLSTTETSKMWIINNQIFKIRVEDWVGTDIQAAIDFYKSVNQSEENIKEYISTGFDRLKIQINNQPGMSTNFAQWGHDSINEFEIWELRELASQYYYDRISDDYILHKDTVDQYKNKFPTIYFIDVDELRDNFIETIKLILEHFNLPINNWNKISSIHETWLRKQIHINKDKQILDIVEALINQQELDWSDWNLTFIDEAVIQRKLLDNNISIKCWQLNDFPTNTKNLLPLLERQQ